MELSKLLLLLKLVLSRLLLLLKLDEVMIWLLSKLDIGSARGEPYESGAETPNELPVDEKLFPTEDPPPPNDSEDVRGMLFTVPDVKPPPPKFSTGADAKLLLEPKFPEL